VLVIDLHAERVPASVGAKAERLNWLAVRGYRVPAAWGLVGDGFPAGLDAVLIGGRRYAVRSSANLEDGAGFSFAGQFRTELDVEAGDVPAAVDRVRASVDDDRVRRYLAGSGIDPATLAMAVIVQEMATPVVSGVVFSRNPLTGLSETIVEAVVGSGEALVSEGRTPSRWVYRWGDRIEAPAEPPLAAEIVEEIVATARRVERDFGAPVDLEWVWDGAGVSWVQLRGITGLDGVAIYSNRIAREVLPGIIKPLVWSVNVPLVNSAWIDLFTEAIGPNDLRPADLAR
jgi:pyruvate,water dikinase